MKKLSVLVALMLIITVGGVYATWDYFQYVTGTANEGKTTITTIALTPKVVEGEDSSTAKGTITASGNLTISIDDTNGDHKGELVVNGDAITVTFKPADNAKNDVKNNGIPMRFELSGENLPNELKIKTRNGYINGDKATMNETIDAATIAGMLSLGDVTLDTPADYDAFAAKLSNAKITVTVYEYVSNDGGTEGGAGGGEWGEPGDEGPEGQ